MIGRVPSPSGMGASQSYSWWVWPVKIAETFALVFVTMFLKTGLADSICSSVALPPSGAPSWYSATTTSASPFDGSPSFSFAATRLTAATGSPKSMLAMPSAPTMFFVSVVTAPTTATLTPLTSSTLYSGSAGVVVPFL